MLKRTKYFIGGLLVALTLGAIAQTGGLPSRPRFLSVGVGTQAPSTNGNVNVAGSVTATNMNVSGSVTASNFVGNVGGVAPSDFARLSQIPNFTGGQAIVTGSDPDFVLLESDTGTDEKRWHMRANANNWRLTLATDAGVDTTNAISVARTGTTVDSIELQATNVQVNGSEVCRQNGTGCPALPSTVVNDNTAETITGLWNFNRGDGQPIFTSGAWQVARQHTSNSLYFGGEAGQWTNVGIRVGGSNVIDCTNSQCTVKGIPSDIICSGGGVCNAGDVAQGQRVKIIKSSTTSRSNTTTPTADPDLQILFGNSNAYKIEFCLNVSGSSTGTQGIRIQFNRTTSGSNFFQWQGSDGQPSGAFWSRSGAGSPGGTLSRQDIPTIDVAGSQTHLCGIGYLVPSSGVTYAVEWSQVSSSANNTNMLAGSWMIFERI